VQGIKEQQKYQILTSLGYSGKLTWLVGSVLELASRPIKGGLQKGTVGAAVGLTSGVSDIFSFVQT